MPFRRLFRSITAAAAIAAAVTPAAAAEVAFPVGSSIGLVPPPGLQLQGNAPGFRDPENNASILLLELPRAAYPQLEKTITTEAAKQQGIIVDHREALFTDAGPALVSAGDDTRQNMRKWMLVATLPNRTVLITVQIPHAARARYPDSVIRDALASLTTRPTPIAEQLGLLPYKLDDMAGFRVVAVLNRNAVVLTDGPSDEVRATGQPHLIIGMAPSGPLPATDRARVAEVAFNNFPGVVERRVTSAEMLRVDGQPVHEIRATGRDAVTGEPVTVVQWLRFGQGAYLRIIGVTGTSTWSRDFPKFRAVRDGIQPQR